LVEAVGCQPGEVGIRIEAKTSVADTVAKIERAPGCVARECRQLSRCKAGGGWEIYGEARWRSGMGRWQGWRRESDMCCGATRGE